MWYENNGDGLFGGRQIMTDQIERVYILHMADFDKDARLDVLISTRLEGGIYYIKQDQDGNFGEKVILDNALSSRYSYAQDMDGDGDVDVVIANTFDVVFFDNKGDGTFDEGVHLAGLTPFVLW